MPTIKGIVRGFEIRHFSDTLNAGIQSALASLSKKEREEYEERAAIMEYDGGLPRAEAERMALERILAKS